MNFMKQCDYQNRLGFTKNNVIETIFKAPINKTFLKSQAFPLLKKVLHPEPIKANRSFGSIN